MLTALLTSHSYFSFGHGVSSPTTLIETAAALGYSHVALTDTVGVYGAVELYEAAKVHGVTPLIGACIPISHKTATYPLYLLAGSRQGYETLNRLITLAKAGDDAVTLSTLEAHSRDLHCLTGGRSGFLSVLLGQRQVSEAVYLLTTLKHTFHDRLWIQLYHDGYPWDLRRASALRRFAREHKVPVVYSPEIRYALPQLMPLYDTLLCGRLGITLSTAHKDRPINDCQAIPARVTLPFQDAIDNANHLASQLHFDLLPDRLIPPPAVVPAGYDSDSYLEHLCR
jgi:error-prone DNA polymerase